MTEDEKKTVIDGFRLLGENGLHAREELQAAIDAGDIDPIIAGEAIAQVEELTFPEVE